MQPNPSIVAKHKIAVRGHTLLLLTGEEVREAKGLLRDRTSGRSGHEGDNKAETSGGE